MEDELGCCGTAEVTCQGGKPCIHESWVCDGRPDCADVADEAYSICSTSSSGSSSGDLRYLFDYILFFLFFFSSPGSDPLLLLAAGHEIRRLYFKGDQYYSLVYDSPRDVSCIRVLKPFR
jgi:hypothetical protein